MSNKHKRTKKKTASRKKRTPRKAKKKRQPVSKSPPQPTPPRPEREASGQEPTAKPFVPDRNLLPLAPHPIQTNPPKRWHWPDKPPVSMPPVNRMGFGEWLIGGLFILLVVLYILYLSLGRG